MLKPSRIFALMLISLWCVDAFAETPREPQVLQGTLDLRSWDFERDGPVSLSGDWRFWWKQLLDPQALWQGSSTIPEASYFPVPQTWNRVENPQTPGSPYPESGYATFALTIKLPSQTTETLGLFLNNADLAYALFGQRGSTPLPAMGNGTVATNAEEEVPLYLPRLITIPQSSADTLQLVWHVSSHRHTRGGPRNAPVIGTERDLHDELMGERLRDMGLIGVLVVMSLYHFALFTLRRKDRAPMWFSLMCLVMGIRQIITSSFFEIFDPDPTALQFELSMKVEYLSIYLATAVFVSFMVHFVYASWYDTFHKGLWAVSIAYTALTLFTSSTVYPRYLTGYHLVILVTIVVTIAHLTRVALQGSTAARVGLVGFVIVALTTINDVLMNQGMIQSTYLAVYGLGFFVFAKSYILARRFSVALDTSERLTEHLQEEVDARTHDLAVRNKSFRDILSNIELALFTINRDHTINPEYSMMTERLYARGSVAGMNFIDVLLPQDCPTREPWSSWIAGAFVAKKDWEGYLKSAPARIVRYTVVNQEGKTESKSFELDFQPISPPDSDEITRLMVITTDITEKAQLQDAVEAREREIAESIAQVTKILDEDPELFECFLDEADELMGNLEVAVLGLREASNADDERFGQIGRDLHTLKGTSAFYNQASLAERVHITEEYLKGARDAGEALSEQSIDDLLTHLDAVRGHLTRAQDVYTQIMKERSQSAAEGEQGQRGPTFIKVNIEHLDQLQTLTSQLLEQTPADERTNMSDEVEACWQRLKKVPAQKLFDRFPRMVRDLARHLDKDVRFDCTGGEIPIARNLFDALEDILVHMIRNAVDHGIDSKQERLQANKLPEGTIELLLTEENAGLTVTLRDDGRGIDPIFLRQRALEKELITEAEANALSDQDAMHLLFRAGFSTAAAVTDISGRGVGMDAVKSMVTEQGGHIQIDSVKGRGTTFRLIFTESSA